jgi:hypothetical protein
LGVAGPAIDEPDGHPPAVLLGEAVAAARAALRSLDVQARGVARLFRTAPGLSRSWD